MSVMELQLSDFGTKDPTRVDCYFYSAMKP